MLTLVAGITLIGASSVVIDLLLTKVFANKEIFKSHL
jgi:hypothetical protein